MMPVAPRRYELPFPRMLAVWVGVLLCLAFPLHAGDVAAAAADGSLWEKTTAELTKGLLDGVSFRAVDKTTLRLRRDGMLGFSGVRTGDVVLEFNDDRSHVIGLTTTIYNKGDDGEMPKASFDNLLKVSQEKLSKLLQSEPQPRKLSKRETGVRLRAWEWETEHCAVLLEASATGSGKKYVAEFIRLSMAPTRGDLERGGADDAAKRAELKANVKRRDDGSVWISNVPMVDQGEKGYCVPASLSRVFAYYGMDGVDQHALAALCRSTGDSGTTLEGMEKALRSISGAFHMSVNSIDWLSRKTLVKEVSRMMQKKHMSPEQLTPLMLLEYVNSKPGLLRKGMKDIKKQIDSGMPVVWAVLLGLFPEQGLPQSMGGHMRLIIGYNEEKQALIYTDSWGGGHEMKAMRLDQACVITQALYVLRPRR